MKQIFVIGQCTLHVGRLEFGNIGNYYIIEPFFRELHRVFPDVVIKTTFQLTEEFQQQERVVSVPMNLYYSWQNNEEYLLSAYKELAIATIYSETCQLIDDTSGYINEVLNSDLVIDYSGDIWGCNADLVGDNRFLIGLLKDRVAQLLGKPTAMIAGSPGPFNRDSILPFARLVFENFSLVTHREPLSEVILKQYGFVNNTTKNLACPAFLFEPSPKDEVYATVCGEGIARSTTKTIGFILCGWNLLKGPFSRTDWQEHEFDGYVTLIEHLIHKYDVNVCLMSHANGFEVPLRDKVQLIHGRDYPLAEHIYNLLQQTDVASKIYLMKGIYSPAMTKGIIGLFDMLISGRVHAAVAGLSQNIPTMIIDYGHEPKAHKLRGFACVAGMTEYVVDPHSIDEMIATADKCWNNRESIQEFLKRKNLEIHALAKQNFDLLRILI